MLTGKHRDELEKFLEDQEATIAITIAPNVGRMAAHDLIGKLKTMMNVIDKSLHGQRYHLKTRTKAWFVVEKQELNAHAHGGMCISDSEIVKVEELFSEGLSKQVFGNKSTYDIKKYCKGWAGYATKSIANTECLILLP